MLGASTITGCGTHAELIATNRSYADLYAETALSGVGGASRGAPDARPLDFVGFNNTASYSSSVWRALCRRAAAWYANPTRRVRPARGR